VIGIRTREFVFSEYADMGIVPIDQRKIQSTKKGIPMEYLFNVLKR